MKKHNYQGLLLLYCLIVSPTLAQISNSYYFTENSRAVIDTIHSIAIVPPWVALDPCRYKRLPGQLKVKQSDASFFLQDLLFSALLRTSTAPNQKLQDIYSVNEKLTIQKADILNVSINSSASSICEMVGTDAVLLALLFYEKSFVSTNIKVAQMIQSIQWNKPIRYENFIIVLYHKTGKPIWAIALQDNDIKTNLREENQLYIGDIISLYGYTGKL